MIALAPLSALYGAAIRARLALYRSGALKTHSAGAPVISVGNLTTGGTGKTPLVEWLARGVAERGRRVCVLTRGYGRADERRRVVVSDGARLLADAREGGDEPRLLAERLLGAASVVSAADRVAAARWAVENLGAQVFVLDDGFQHVRLKRDLDVVTIDATSPWGGRRLLPRGRLREPVAGLRRADCVVITRADLAEDLDGVRAEVERLTRAGALVVTSRLRTLGARPLSREAESSSQSETGAAVFNLEAGMLSLEDVPRPLAAFCAVGNPLAFFSQLRAEAVQLNFERAFADHHAYTQSDAEALEVEAAKRGARALLTTAKDAVKLRALYFSLPVYVVETSLEFDDEDALRKAVSEAVER
ncbi:MAG TPA: tetraacyldisaccharide 4'-kinase [Pyrinomonadaceae bacterium]|nr:tetraacyldisaccharide 4'-kinase [Pyrinomonadaceae bacterium]